MIMVLALHGAKRRHGDVRRKSSGILQLANETRLNLIMILVVVRMFLLYLTGWYRISPETKKSQAVNLGFNGKL